MKFRLKSLFVVTLVTALLIGCIVQDRRTLHDVQTLREDIEQVLVEMNEQKSFAIGESQHRNDFVLFSSGRIGWDVALEKQAEVKIDLTWDSRLFFSKQPKITLAHQGIHQERQFADRLKEKIQKQKPYVVVNQVVQ